MQPRMLVTFDTELRPLPVSVRVGQVSIMVKGLCHAISHSPCVRKTIAGRANKGLSCLAVAVMGEEVIFVSLAGSRRFLLHVQKPN